LFRTDHRYSTLQFPRKFPGSPPSPPPPRGVTYIEAKRAASQSHVASQRKRDGGSRRARRNPHGEAAATGVPARCAFPIIYSHLPSHGLLLSSFSIMPTATKARNEDLWPASGPLQFSIRNPFASLRCHVIIIAVRHTIQQLGDFRSSSLPMPPRSRSLY
jgi:hypothetical protein